MILGRFAEDRHRPSVQGDGTKLREDFCDALALERLNPRGRDVLQVTPSTPRKRSARGRNAVLGCLDDFDDRSVDAMRARVTWMHRHLDDLSGQGAGHHYPSVG